MVLKSIGSPLGLGEQLSKQYNKYKHQDCTTQWRTYKANNIATGTLRYIAQEGDAMKYSNFRREAHTLTDICDYGSILSNQ